MITQQLLRYRETHNIRKLIINKNCPCKFNIKMNQNPANYQNPEPQVAENSQQPAEVSQVKKKPPRQTITLKPQHFEKKNGLQALYTSIDKIDFTKGQEKVEASMDKIMSVLKTWHFEMLPRYSFDYFLQRCKVLGNHKFTQSYMQKVRRIHKGEDKWGTVEQNQQPMNGQNGDVQGNQQHNPEQNYLFPTGQNETLEERMERAIRLTGQAIGDNLLAKEQKPNEANVAIQAPDFPEEQDEFDQLFKQMDIIQKERREILDGSKKGKVESKEKATEENAEKNQEQPYIPEGFDMNYQDESYE